jgi:hypothetical protein
MYAHDDVTFEVCDPCRLRCEYSSADAQFEAEVYRANMERQDDRPY